MPLSEAEVEELFENLKLDDNDNCTKENIIEVRPRHNTNTISHDYNLQLFTQ